LIVVSIKHFQTLDTATAPILATRIDFKRLGLMGHSRGGDAVVTLPSIISLPGVSIRGALARAPCGP